MNDEAVYRTAPATPGLLKMYTLLYGYKSDNKDYHYINIQITLAVQNFLINTKRFVY